MKLNRPVVALLLLMLLVACGPRVATEDLPAIPEVSTVDFMPSVREQLEQLRGAVKSKPRSATAAGQLGMAYMAYRQHEAASAALERARLLDSRKWQWQYLSAIARTEIGDYVGAVALLEETSKERPEELMVRTRLGLAYAVMGELQKSAAILADVVAADPELAEAVVGLARALIKLDRANEAQGHLERLLELYGPSATTYFALAEASRRLGEREKSEEYYALSENYRGVGLPSRDSVVATIRKYDRSEKALVRHARRLTARGKTDNAIDALNEALEINPDSTIIRASLIGAYGALRQFDKVDEQYRLALQSGPPNATLLRSLGRARVYQKRFDVARDLLRQSLQINPQDAVTHTWLGIASRGQGSETEAIESFHKALDLDPLERTARLNIAEMLLRKHRFDDAINHLEHLLVPESEATLTALFFMGQALAAKGQFAEARGRFDEAIDLATRRGNSQMVAQIQSRVAKLP